MDFALQEFHWGLPFNESLDGHFVPVFKRPEDVLNASRQHLYTSSVTFHLCIYILHFILYNGDPKVLRKG